MLFASLHERLIAHVRERVRSGELTERGLARVTGMSQPHLHNVLKGVRSLSSSYADLLLSYLDLSLIDFLSAAEEGKFHAASRPGTVEVPFLRGMAGPTSVLETIPSPGDVYPLPTSIAAALHNPVIVALSHDPELSPNFQAGDMALAARVAVTRENLDNSAFYLIKTDMGTLVRSLRIAGKRIYLLTPYTRDEPRKWDYVVLRGQQPADVIVGKIAWIGRQFKN